MNGLVNPSDPEEARASLSKLDSLSGGSMLFGYEGNSIRLTYHGKGGRQ